MPGTFDQLQAKGFKFVTVSELIAMGKPMPPKEPGDGRVDARLLAGCRPERHNKSRRGSPAPAWRIRRATAWSLTFILQLRSRTEAASPRCSS